jgi:hypothetical protein
LQKETAFQTLFFGDQTGGKLVSLQAMWAAEGTEGVCIFEPTGI